MTGFQPQHPGHRPSFYLTLSSRERLWSDRHDSGRVTGSQVCFCRELGSRLGFQTDLRTEVSSSASQGLLALAPPLPCPTNHLARHRHRQPKQSLVARALAGMACPIIPASLGTQSPPGHVCQGHLAWPRCQLPPSVVCPLPVAPLEPGMPAPAPFPLCFCGLPERTAIRTEL